MQKRAACALLLLALADVSTASDGLNAGHGGRVDQASKGSRNPAVLRVDGSPDGGGIVGAGSSALVWGTVIAGLMCIANDQYEKHRAITTCTERGTTVVMEDTGVCGFKARYRCAETPPSAMPMPVPAPASR